MEGPKQNSSTTDVRFNEKAQKDLKKILAKIWLETKCEARNI